MIRAFATPIACALVGFCSGFGACLTLPTLGIIGNPWVGVVEACSTGCVGIGPVVGSSLGIRDNQVTPIWFKATAKPAGVNRRARLESRSVSVCSARSISSGA